MFSSMTRSVSCRPVSLKFSCAWQARLYYTNHRTRPLEYRK